MRQSTSRVIKDRLSNCCFYSAPEYEDAEIVDMRNARILLANLFITSMKALNKTEFDVVGTILRLEDSWNNQADAPSETYTHSTIPLKLNYIAMILNCDLKKLAAILKGAFEKLPILKEILSEQVVSDTYKFLTSSVITKSYLNSNLKDTYEKIGKEIDENVKKKSRKYWIEDEDED